MRCAATAVGVALAALAASAPSALAGSADNEYTLNIPRAGHAQPDAAPNNRAGGLPPAVHGRLEGANNALLRQVATARAFGAPTAAHRPRPAGPLPGQSRGGLGAGNPAVLGLAAAIVAVAGVGISSLWRRRGAVPA
jgi:hypothetical protein